MDQEQPINEGGDAGIFDLALEDSDLLDLVKKPIRESQDYWDDTVGLKKVRQSNKDLWLPNHWKNKEIYDYQEDYLYQDNRIFSSVETICSVVNSRTPQPSVMPSQNTIVSLQMGKDLQKALFAYADKYRVLDMFKVATRSLLLKRVGFIKLRFDKSIGDYGEIVTEHILPEDIIVDKDAKWGEIPRFYAQIIRNKSIEELIAHFPDSRNKLLALAGATRTDKEGNLVAYKTMLAKKKDVYEIWFKYEDNKSGVAWVDVNFQHVLGKTRNPNWNYTEKKGYSSNLLDNPTPPFLNLNYLNDGSSFIDQTTMIEQAAPLQKVLDRRGFQIMENAEMAGSGIIFNTLMIKKEDIAKLSGHPDERVGVKGNVNEAMARVSPPLLPNYVIEDKIDARNEIDNIFATHDISRGQQSNNKTLGQDKLQMQQDYTRMDDIARAVERMASQYYRYLAQMMKVYYTEDHWYKITGEDGQFDFIVMRSDLIEDGVDVSVEAGSTLPINKDRQTELVAQLAPLGMVDPLTIYEVATGGNLPSPQKMLERWVTYKTDPASYLTNAKEDEFSREAFMDVQVLNAGEMPNIRDEYPPTYFSFMNNYMLSGDFEKQPDIIKQMYVEYLRIAQEQAAKQLQAMQTQLPTPEDMQGANQQALEQAQLEGQMMNGQPQSDIPDKANALAQKVDQKQNPLKTA